MTKLPDGYTIAPMTRAEASVLESWAAAEGWNPGVADMDIAWASDPDAFIALRKDGELAGGGAIIAYGRKAGFMGLFIMRSDLRRQGLGRVLWHERLEALAGAAGSGCADRDGRRVRYGAVLCLGRVSPAVSRPAI